MLVVKRARGQKIVIDDYDFCFELEATCPTHVRIFMYSRALGTERFVLGIGQRRQINTQISLSLVRAKNKQASIGITAPLDRTILREELHQNSPQMVDWRSHDDACVAYGGVF